MSALHSSIYSLTWGDYGTSLVSAVQLLRVHGDLVDVTLAAGGRSFPAHKIVLCAASPFLLDLLKNTPCKHPVVMLAGVNANDLEALLEFVYRGEVSVDHSQLPSLLQAAHCLNIQGLAPQAPQKDDNTYTTTSIQLHPIVQPHQMKTVVDIGGQHYTTDDQLITVQAAPTQTIQAEVIEDIAHLPEVATKDEISQYLPQRKRKPRAKKQEPVAKLAKLDDGTVTMTTGNTVTVQTTSASASENGIPITTIKTEKVDASATPTTTPGGTQQPSGTPGKLETSTTSTTSGTPSGKTKSKSQSEQPATCPICSAIIRQSRNLRRHLELRHFKKQGTKKSKKAQAAAAAAAAAAAQIKQEVMETGEASTSGQGQTIVTVTGNQLADGTVVTSQPQQVVMSENADGTTSLSIAHVQTLSGQTLSLANLNQATLIRTEDGLESGMITTHDGSNQRQTELLRYGNTIYTIEERQPDS
ncbi:transcription activator GAGA [Culicoides brevitarsis]|uniref:transcription activator GAGA n=1 Tax=Culicoides brevitarsis TaxID=469753 RepID=UPI00307BFD72